MQRYVTITIDDELKPADQLRQAALACASPYDVQFGLSVILTMAAERMPCDSAIRQEFGELGLKCYHKVLGV